ncbi:hypothetical protein PT974_01693 [Cladobotryum mycophilum]|uniref:Uncharacterized protein n=1 Tax=Cladobotryum mycophilum TaxID=491253 RepID=A0ABR0SW58_9HYPO
MKFTTVATVFLAAGAQAQTSVISGVISGLADKTGALDDTVRMLDLDAFTKGCDDIVADMLKGATTIQGSSGIGAGDVISLTTSFSSLANKGLILFGDLKAKRDVVQNANACDLIRTKLGNFNKDSKPLIDAFLSKVPSLAQSSAKGLVNKVLAVLDQAIDDFSEKNCKNLA